MAEETDTLITTPAVRRHRILKMLLVNILVLLTLLVIAEGSLRLAHVPFNIEWEPTENAIARFDSQLGWSYIPGLSKKIDFEAYRREVFTNADGIRVPSSGYTFSPNAPSALFIGCSYTMGHGLSFEESFVGQFAKLAGDKLQTVNLGVQAYGTDQALLALKKFAPRFKPKVVVYTFMDEHIIRNGNYDRRMLIPNARFIGTKPLFALDSKQEPYLAKKPLLYSQYLHSWLFDALTMKLGSRMGVFPPYPEKLTHALIREMDRYCKERNIRFILLNWRWHEQEYHNFNSLNVEYIDTLTFAPPLWDRMRIPGDNHPDAEAGGYVAGYLFSYLFTVK